MKEIEKIEIVVTEELCATNVGSGEVAVYATPMMIALMEATAAKLAKQYLAQGETTVGTKVDISHHAATPVGMRVWAEAKLTERDGRRFAFEVTCYDECGKIGEGTHERFAVNVERFQAKTNAKMVK